MTARTKSIAEVAVIIGCNKDTLYARRIDDRIDLGDGRYLRLIRIGRKLRVANVELARFLGELPDDVNEAS